MRNLIKKYFPVQVGLIAWSVPQCAGGVFLLLEADQTALDDVVKKVVMNADDYKFTPGKNEQGLLTSAKNEQLQVTNREGAIDMIESVTF